MNANGTGLKQLTFSTGGIGSYHPAMSPSGRKIVFTSEADLIPGGNADLNAEIFVINVEGAGLRQLTHTTGGDPNNFGGNTHPRMSWSEQKVSFSSDRDLVLGSNTDGNHELFLVNADGGGVRQLTNTTGGYGVFIASGLDMTDSKVAFDTDRDMVPGGNIDGNWDLFMMNINGTGLVQLTHTTGGTGCIGPVWTLNGQTVAFWSDRNLLGNNADEGYEVFRMQVNGTALVQVTAGTGGYLGSAPWGIAAKGTVMAVESDRDLVPGGNGTFNLEIYLIELRP
jgi:Tol biopolymer transport system component